MAGQTFNLSIVVEATTDKASSSLEGLNSNIKTLGATALGLGGAAVAGLGAAAASITNMVIEAAPLEGIKGAFEGLAESSGRSATELLSALQKGSAGMVSQADLMKTYNQAASLVGTTFANELPNAMDYLGKVSAATGEDMGYLLDSLTKGVGRLSPAILDNLAIQVDLTSANEVYAESIGKTAAELTKGEQQTALMAQVMEKLAANTAAMPDVLGSATQGIASMKARFVDFKNDAALALMPALSGVMEILGDLADRILPVVADVIATKVVPAIEKGADFFEVIAGAVSTFLDALDDGKTVTGAFKTALLELLPAETVIKIFELVDSIKEFLAPIVTAISGFVEWKDVLAALGVVIAAVVIPAVVSIIATLAPLILTAVAIIAIIALLRNAWESDWMGIATKTKEAIDIAKGLIEQGVAIIKALWEKHGESLLAAAKAAWDGIMATIDLVVANIKDIIDLFIAVFTGDWETAWEKVKSITSRTLDAAKNVIDSTLTTIKTLFSDTWDNIKLAVSSKVTDVKDSIAATMASVVENLKSIDLVQIGKDLIEGLKTGIEAKLQDVINSVIAAAKAIIDAAKAAIGAASPAKAFIELGETIPQGLALGMYRSADVPENALRSIVNNFTQNIYTTAGASAVIHGYDTLRALV